MIGALARDLKRYHSDENDCNIVVMASKIEANRLLTLFNLTIALRTDDDEFAASWGDS